MRSLRRTPGLLAAVERFEVIDHDLSVAQIPVSNCSAILGKTFDPGAETAGGGTEFGIDLRFCELHVAIKCVDRLRFQIFGINCAGREQT